MDLNQNGIQDYDELGVKDVLVELRTPAKRSVEHATETGSNGEFQFILDALDFTDPLGDEEFYVQFYSPDGYKFSLPLDDDALTVNGDVMASIPFQVVLGETYEVNTSLMTACDPSLALISFLGIKSASSLKGGSIAIEWDAAELLPYDDNVSLDCNDDDILYHVFVAPAPFDYYPYSLAHLVKLSNIIHIETDEVDTVIHDVEAGDTVAVLVMASAFDIVSYQHEQREVTMQYYPKLEPDDDGEPFYEFDGSVASSHGESTGMDLRMVSTRIISRGCSEAIDSHMSSCTSTFSHSFSIVENKS